MRFDALLGILAGATLYLALIFTYITICQKIAQAAFRKRRSYRSFFWLSLLVSPVISGFIVAAMPFDPQDPRSPEQIRANNPTMTAKYSGSRRTGVTKAAIAFALGTPVILIIAVLVNLTNNY